MAKRSSRSSRRSRRSRRHGDAATGIDLRNEVLYPTSEGGQLGNVFRWLTRNGMGMYFPGTPIGWYQNHQIHAIDVIQERAKSAGLPLDRVRVHHKMVQAMRDGRWHDVVPTTVVYDEASRRSRK